MSMPTPNVEYFALSPMLIVFGAAIVGVVVEAFLPRRFRYASQVLVALASLVAAFVADVLVGKRIPSSGQTAVLRAVAVDRPALVLQGIVLLVAILAILFIAERSAATNTPTGQALPRSRSVPGSISSPRRRPRFPTAWLSAKRFKPGTPRPRSFR
ncbi:NADH-quinone oxidoreductase subunit N domain protein [Mycobacterium xenopi 4042]|uniref:NADH-quinone oxidoreductase subunit N domain protein n=1 Tax=Mycobacterium xenopi 4042 TaxID=1299334 RepID=X7Z2L8_MYCXE|nr:NADH-quinone oxidoreductase subunit N domain protein [Mycobacterium xenopi 4042]